MTTTPAAFWPAKIIPIQALDARSQAGSKRIERMGGSQFNVFATLRILHRLAVLYGATKEREVLVR